MDITPFDVYLVMQMDSISDIFIVLSCIFGALAFIGLLAYVPLSDKIDENGMKRHFKRVKVAFVLFIMFCVTSSLIPNTKTLAAMYILPKVANSEFVNETMPTEARELLDLTKEAIRSNLIEKKPETP